MSTWEESVSFQTGVACRAWGWRVHGRGASLCSPLPGHVTRSMALNSELCLEFASYEGRGLKQKSVAVTTHFLCKGSSGKGPVTQPCPCPAQPHPRQGAHGATLVQACARLQHVSDLRAAPAGAVALLRPGADSHRSEGSLCSVNRPAFVATSGVSRPVFLSQLRK